MVHAVCVSVAGYAKDMDIQIFMVNEMEHSHMQT